MANLQVLLLAILAIVFIISVVGNICLILFTIKIYKRELTINVYITCICISDLCSCILGVIPEFVVVYKTDFIDPGNVMCVLSGLAAFTFCLVSMHMCSVMSFVQMLSIRYPFFYRVHLTKLSLNICVVTLVTMYSFLWGVSPYWFGFGFVPDFDRRRCTIDWRYKNIQSYLLLLIFISLVVPTIVQLVSAYVSRKQLLKVRRKAKTVRNKHAKFYIKVTIITITAFIISWTPYTVVGFLVSIGVHAPDYMFTFAALFAKLSTICNPIIYFVLSKRFRRFVRRGLVVEISTQAVEDAKKSSQISRQTSLTSAYVAVIANKQAKFPKITESNNNSNK